MEAKKLSEMSRVDFLLRDLACDVDRRRMSLVSELRSLAEKLAHAADTVEAGHTFNSLGEVQHRGSEVDRLCGELRLAMDTQMRVSAAVQADKA